MVDTIDPRAFNVHWRGGKLYSGHNFNDGDGRNKARWLQFDTNDWPTSGLPTLAQTGVIDLGGSIHTFDPAVYANEDGAVGVVFASSSSTQNVRMHVAGRVEDDAPGTFGPDEVVDEGSVGSDGRWGDYYDITVDPTDDETFWAIGQTSEPFGWSTFVQEFRVPTEACPGDVNGDDLVDLADFSIIGSNFGGGPGLERIDGDLDGDGFVGLSDFAELGENFGASCL